MEKVSYLLTQVRDSRGRTDAFENDLDYLDRLGVLLLEGDRHESPEEAEVSPRFQPYEM